MTTTTKEWHEEYTKEGEWTIHRASQKSKPWDLSNENQEDYEKYVAEVCWKTKDGKLEYKYQLTEYRYNYGVNLEDDDENCYINYNITNRRQYKSRNALMNALRRIK